MIGGIGSACCIYDKEKEKIILFYVGDVESGALITQLKKKLPRYMIPNHVYALEQMPLTANGKTDRNKLKQIYEGKEKEKIIMEPLMEILRTFTRMLILKPALHW